MFQDFSFPSCPKDHRKPISALRRLMEEKTITGFLIPRSDEHQGEYVPAYAERLAYITGFTGSAGTAIIMNEKAAIFVDGRYTIQVKEQINCDILQPYNSLETSPFNWLEEQLQQEDRLAYDPWLHTVDEIEKLEEIVDRKKASLIPTNNLIDEIWPDQKAPPQAPVQIHPLDYAGKPTTQKISAIQNDLLKTTSDGFFFTQPDSICWLLNIRGRDIPHTPLALCFLYLPQHGKPTLFIDRKKLVKEVRQYLEALVHLANTDSLLPFLEKQTGKTGIAPQTTSIIFKQSLENSGTIQKMVDPCLLPKACKNEKEIAGARTAHLRDGLAMVTFLQWITMQNPNTLDEIQSAKKLEESRKSFGERWNMPLKDISFDTISGFGANGAIVHYRVTEETNRKFQEGNLYLLDSGAQYQDGTTDITRTLAIGAPTSEMKRHFTLVLKGMIAISSLKFPKDTSGAQIDVLARHALWQNGLDYDHGTGHGVGSFLSVHEGPQRISKVSKTPLKTGMILSNEPGFYKEGQYGIRIENLIIVRDEGNIKEGERPMMSFETLTLAPIDKSLIELTLLSMEERDWLNSYHAEVFGKLSPHLNEDVKNWLKNATEKI